MIARRGGGLRRAWPDKREDIASIREQLNTLATMGGDHASPHPADYQPPSRAREQRMGFMANLLLGDEAPTNEKQGENDE